MIAQLELDLNNLEMIGNRISESLDMDSIIHIYRFEFNTYLNSTANFNRNTFDGFACHRNY